MINKSTYRLLLFQNAFKIFLIVSTFGMSLHCANLLLGINFCIVELTIVLSLFPFLVLFGCTFVLKLCNLSRGILAYDFLVSNCIYAQKNYAFFGGNLTLARWIVLICGLVISTFLIWKMYKQFKCK